MYSGTSIIQANIMERVNIQVVHITFIHLCTKLCSAPLMYTSWQSAIIKQSILALKNLIKSSVNALCS